MSGTRTATIKEIVERINSSPTWEGFGKGHEIADGQRVVNDLLNLELEFDAIPLTVITYYPFCDCGERVLEQRLLMSEELTLYGYAFMETCYECGVISSD